MDEPSRPPKKPRRGAEHESLVVNPESSNRKEIKTQIHMNLHSSAGDSGAAMVIDYTKFLVDACSTLSPDVWDRFKTGQNTGGIINFMLMSSLVIGILVLSHSIITYSLNLANLFVFFFLPDLMLPTATECRC